VRRPLPRGVRGDFGGPVPVIKLRPCSRSATVKSYSSASIPLLLHLAVPVYEIVFPYLFHTHPIASGPRVQQDVHKMTFLPSTRPFLTPHKDRSISTGSTAPSRLPLVELLVRPCPVTYSSESPTRVWLCVWREQTTSRTSRTP
jgi:hypothetical protein